MNYVLVYPVHADVNTTSKKEAGARVEEGLAYDDAGKAGHVVVTHALQPVPEATTICSRKGTLPGFLMIEAQDPKSIEVAARRSDRPPRQHRDAADHGASLVRRMR